ncbi:MAG: glutathione S-transferase [Pseudomonadota bacterium]
MAVDTQPTLYSFRRCPYAMRARLALQSAGIACWLREVVLRDKPAEMLSLSPKGTVPVLVLPGGAVIDESLDIMLWALSQSDPEDWLRPDQGSQADMLALIGENDRDFKHHLDRYKYPNRYEGAVAETHRGHGLSFLQSLDDQLKARGQLFGHNVSLADMALVPFVRQFANTDRSWFDTLDLPALQAWLADHLSSARFRQIMHKYPKWAPGADEPVFPGAFAPA